jgi:hypothetical protein
LRRVRDLEVGRGGFNIILVFARSTASVVYWSEFPDTDRRCVVFPEFIYVM